MNVTKTCKRCGADKALADFPIRAKGSIDGHRGVCIECRNASGRMRYADVAHEPSTVGEKSCRTCGILKALTEFYRHSSHVDGRMDECKSCKLDYEKRRRLDLLSEARGLKPEIVHVPNGCKQCKGCGEAVPFSGFTRSKQYPDGYLPYCKTCRNAYDSVISKRRRARKHVEHAAQHQRICMLCGVSFPESDAFFYKSRTSYSFDDACRLCTDHLISQMNRLGKVNKYPAAKLYMVRLKIQVLAHYSGGVPKCSCCGEREILFLSIDHIDGGGLQHRKAIGDGYHFYSWIRREGFPGGLRCLCHNCNMARGFYGACPHETLGQAPLFNP